MNILLSVIIPTYNREETLVNTVSNIAKTQSYNNFELIIVDQSENYSRELQGSRLSSIFRDQKKLKYFAVDFIGLPKARNFGISVARGDVVLFLDDDVETSADLFYEHVSTYGTSSDIGSVAGRVIENPDIFTNTNRVGGQVLLTGKCLRNFNYDGLTFVMAAPGGNMSFKKEVLDKVGFFDEGYIGTSELEETDYCYRVRKSGFRIIFNGRASLVHLISPSGGCRDKYYKRQYYKMYNLGYFLSKHSSVWGIPIFLPYQAIVILKRVFINSNIKILDGISEAFRLFQGFILGYIKGRCMTEKV